MPEDGFIIVAESSQPLKGISKYSAAAHFLNWIGDHPLKSQIAGKNNMIFLEK